ncbi:MAG: anthranilate synthase component I family protein [Planctomycetes bacterium]|nr:anthranilate synthase component I family protein [Planctomycetota bacterium]
MSPSSPTIVVTARSVEADFDPWLIVRALPTRWRPILLDSGGDVERARWSLWAARPTQVHAVRAAELLPLARDDRARRLYGPLAPPEVAWRIEAELAIDELPFLGGWIGRIDYEAGALCAARPLAPRDPRAARDVLRFGFYPRVYLHDRREHRVLRCELRNAPARRSSRRSARRATRVADRCAGPSAELAAYEARVEEAQRLIAAGDIYQVNLSAELARGAALDARRLYGALRAISPAPYGAFAAEPEGALLCNSPELHFRTRGLAWHTEPIKGTRARGAEPRADRAAREELLASEKDRAELAMIVDLYRNDLGRLALPGSVRVPEGIQLRSFANVHHLMAEVLARSAARIDPARALLALFPAGSITGAPKQRAMEIVRALEERDRGIYCGAIGAVDVRGEMMFNVAIRSAEVVRGELSLRMGAGIVADSSPASELAELHAKAAAWRRALACVSDHSVASRRRNPSRENGAPADDEPRRPSPEAASVKEPA